MAGEWCHPVDDGEREIEEYGNAEDDKNDGNGEGCYQAYNFLNNVELQIFFLEFNVFLERLDEFYYGLYILVAG